MIAILAMVTFAAAADPAGCPLAARKQPDWRVQCDAAIDAEKDAAAKSMLLFRSAYAYNEDQRPDLARPALEQAVKLDPTNGLAWHELGYTANDVGDYADGAHDLDTAVTLRPDNVENYRERALSRHYNGDLAGAFADRDQVVRMSPGDADALMARAEAASWVGKFADARRDADSAGAIAARTGNTEIAESVTRFRERLAALSMAPGDDPGKTCRALMAGKTDGKMLVAACSAAFAGATTPADKAEFLTGRSLAYLIADQDEDASVEDNQVAAGLMPNDPKMLSNLGYAYVRVHHSWAAERAFDRSLAIRPIWVALAGRAVARFNQKNYDGALADAQAANAIHPNEVAMTVIGDVASARGDVAAAKKAWLDAWRSGDRDDGLIARLKEVGVIDPSASAKPN